MILQILAKEIEPDTGVVTQFIYNKRFSKYEIAKKFIEENFQNAFVSRKNDNIYNIMDQHGFGLHTRMQLEILRVYPILK